MFCDVFTLQDMQQRGTWGHIINMVGLSGHRIPDAPAGGTFFSASKHAVRALTEGLRQEVGHTNACHWLPAWRCASLVTS
jgi:NADP-dependent 3-hydroxy acid dehydrogenase YdfG